MDKISKQIIPEAKLKELTMQMKGFLRNTDRYVKKPGGKLKKRRENERGFRSEHE